MSDSPMKGIHRAMNSGQKRAQEMHHSVEQALVDVPAFPMSDKEGEFLATKPSSKEDRRREYLTTRNNPRLIAAKAAEQAARWNLPKHKPYSRQVVEYFLAGEKEFGGS